MVQMKLDLKGSGVDVNKSGFEPYEGPLPTPGVFAAVLTNIKVRVSQAGNPYFNCLFEFADQAKPEKQQYKGYPLWAKIVPGESDIQKERVAKLLHTISGKDPEKVNVSVVHDEITDGGAVTKVGGKDPVGTKCKVIIVRSTYNGEPIVELRDLFPWPANEDWPEGEFEDVEDVEVEEEEEDPDEAEEEAEEEDEPDDEEEEEDDEEEDDGEFEARQEELGGMNRAALKTVLKELDSDFKVLKRHSDEDLRTAILDLEFPVDEEEGEDGEPPF